MKLIKRRISRSIWGDILLRVVLLLIAMVMILPFVYAISSSLKPSNELWIFPPRFFARNPTLQNYADLFNLMQDSWVPMTRYIFNTVFITLAGTVGHIVIASLAAYPLSRYQFPGTRAFFKMVQTSLMFSPAVLAIPNFLIMSKIGFVDTYAALIVPALGSSLGLFLMKQFMDQMVHPAVLESASMDGASEWRKFFSIVMPMVKPAWLTLTIFSVQSLWTVGSTVYIYSEELKTLSYALGQIQAAGVARQGVGAAVSVVMLLVPLTVFIVTQSNIIETMGASGIKD